MSVTKGTRVGYTVMYGTKPHTRYVTEFGRITALWPPDRPTMARIAVENPKPGRSTYVIRKMRDVERAEPDTPLAAALAEVDRAQASARSHMPDGSLGSFPTNWERESLRALAEVVRKELGQS